MVPPLLIAHRGASAEAPENTLVALQRAIEVGVPAAEVDVRETADGHLVLMHDETADRTTDGSGAVAQMTLDELRALDAGSWKDSRYQGERVPTLQQALELASGKLLLVIEIKQEGLTAAVHELLDDRARRSGVAIVSFSYRECCHSRAMSQSTPVAWLGPGACEGDVAGARNLCRKALLGHIQALSVRSSGASETLRRETRRSMLGLWAWTVDEPEEIVALADRGVDSITTNRPIVGLAAVRDWAAHRSANSSAVP